MTWWSRRVSPVRFLLCAVFMGIAFILASWTSARADDKGLLSSVTDAVPSVERVVETAADDVVSTSAAVPIVELEPVVKPVASATTKAVSEPVAAVDATTSAVVESTSKVLSDTTVRVTDTVKDIAPLSAAVVEPAVEVVDVVVPVTREEDPTPLPDVPDVTDAADEVIDVIESDSTRSGASRRPVDLDKPVVVAPVTPSGASPRAAVAQASLDEEHSLATLSDLAVPASAPQLTAGHGVRSPGERLPAGPPSGPLGVAAGGATAPTSGGSSTSGGADGALTASLFDLPEPASVSVASVQLCHAPGPCADPGSRPG